MALLVIYDPGATEPRTHGIAQAHTTIGRGLGNTVVLCEDDGVSLRHAVITRTQTGYELLDQESTNGTWVNRQRTWRHTLEDGDRIRLGDTELVFHRHAHGT